MNHYILVTGGAGFIGSNLVMHLANQYQIIVVDDLSMGQLDNLDLSKKNITFIKGNVCDTKFMEDLLKKYSFNYIFHLAAIASVAYSVENPEYTHQVNCESVLQLLSLTKKYCTNLKRFVFTSSAAVYGNEPTLPKKENSIIQPQTPYAIDKFTAEQYTLMYNHLYDLPTSAVRFFNVYGPKQNPSSPYSGVISIFTNQLSLITQEKEAQFSIFGDGSQSRDFVFIQDVVQALWFIANTDESKGEVFNIGTGNKTSLLELIQSTLNNCNLELPINYKEARLGDIPHSYSDISKLQQLGFKPQYSIQSGMTELLTYLEII